MRDARRLDVSDRTVAFRIDLLVGTAVALLATFNTFFRCRNISANSGQHRNNRLAQLTFPRTGNACSASKESIGKRCLQFSDLVSELTK